MSIKTPQSYAEKFGIHTSSSGTTHGGGGRRIDGPNSSIHQSSSGVWHGGGGRSDSDYIPNRKLNPPTNTYDDTADGYETDKWYRPEEFVNGDTGAYNGGRRVFNMIDNYIYFYHLDKFMLLPAYPQSIGDTISINYPSNVPLSRSAPIYSYANSGPRSFTVDLKLHRDMMQDINYNRSNYILNNLASGRLDDDYVDALARELQACVYPKYEASSRTVKPPMIAIRFGAEIFCKGIVTNAITVTYSGPLLSYTNGDKYAEVNFNFAIAEVDPYSAETIIVNGSFRGLNSTLEKGLFRTTDTTGAGNRAVDNKTLRII